MPVSDPLLDAYYRALPEDRRGPMLALRDAIRKALPKGFVEQLLYGMPYWVVPRAIYPAGYHCDPKLPLPFLAIASQKNFIALYHLGLYADAKLSKAFEDDYAKADVGKLDMGKSCVRFKKPEKIPLGVISALAEKLSPAQWIALYEREVKS